MRKPLNQKSATKLLSSKGWCQTAGGKHVVKMSKPGHRPITLPTHKGRDYSPGLARAILRQAGIDPKDL
jgi:predicted RNA binding protein YcfA (HicA-like mRNA interferase family)